MLWSQFSEIFDNFRWKTIVVIQIMGKLAVLFWTKTAKFFGEK
jgi:hypothetical protein